MPTVKSQAHTDNLVRNVAGLIPRPDVLYSDVQVEIENLVFRCHRLILAMSSKYFQQKCFPDASCPHEEKIIVQNVALEDFKQVLTFIYMGEIDLNNENVENIFSTAISLMLPELKQMCVDYMLRNLDSTNCLRYWKLAESENEPKIINASKSLYMKYNRKVLESHLSLMTEGMLKALLADDEFQVESEDEACQLLLRWIEQQTACGRSVKPYQLLSSLRWWEVSVEYVKSKLMSNSTLLCDQPSFEFLSRVISYKLTGVQSLGIRTFHRHSSGLEKSVVLTGVNTIDKVMSDVYHLSLSRSDCITKLPDLPTQISSSSAACVVGDVLYVIGALGSEYNETWMWTTITGWSKCGDLIQGRRGHCAAVVAGTDIYILGGWVDSTLTCLSGVEQYNRISNKWKQAGHLTRVTQFAACAVHKTSIYVFGGIGCHPNTKEDVDLDCIQVYDTTNKECTVLKQRLSLPERVLRAVQWDKSVILMNNRSCFIFDIETQKVQQRNQFAPGLVHFGLVIENETLFIVGGGTTSTNKDGKETWTFSDEVKCVPVMVIINNQPTANWVHHAKLPQKGLIHAFGVRTLFTQ